MGASGITATSDRLVAIPVVVRGKSTIAEEVAGPQVARVCHGSGWN